MKKDVVYFSTKTQQDLHIYTLIICSNRRGILLTMSFPNIPDVEPKINLKRNDVINLLLSSIAFEELSLAHILNAEGEKLQKGIEKACSVDELIDLNRSVEKMLRAVIKKEMLLQFKLEDVLEIPEKDKDYSPPHKK